MAVGDIATVDNVHAGGLAASVDLMAGRLSPATDMGVDAKLGWIDRDPDTGASIAGRVLPMWSEVRDLVLTAQAAFRDWVVIGWDVATTASPLSPPRVVEGNGGPDIDLVQRPLRVPFGDARFGALLAFRLGRCEQPVRAPSGRSWAPASVPARYP